MQNETTEIAARIRTIIASLYGSVDERLMASGIIDSLRAVELALVLGKEFGVNAGTFALSDMATITMLSARIAVSKRT